MLGWHRVPGVRRAKVYAAAPKKTDGPLEPVEPSATKQLATCDM